MMTSNYNASVFWSPQGAQLGKRDAAAGWYFWDETGTAHFGPYETERVAIELRLAYWEQVKEAQKLADHYSTIGLLPTKPQNCLT